MKDRSTLRSMPHLCQMGQSTKLMLLGGRGGGGAMVLTAPGVAGPVWSSAT